MLLLVFALLYTQPIVSSSQMLVDYNWDIYKQHYSGFFGVMFNGFFGIDMVVLEYIIYRNSAQTNTNKWKR